MIPTVSTLPALAAEKRGHFHCAIQLAEGLGHPLESLFAHKSAAGSRCLAQGSHTSAEVVAALALQATLQTPLNLPALLRPQLMSPKQTHGLLQQQASRRWWPAGDSWGGCTQASGAMQSPTPKRLLSASARLSLTSSCVHLTLHLPSRCSGTSESVSW